MNQSSRRTAPLAALAAVLAALVAILSLAGCTGSSGKPAGAAVQSTTSSGPATAAAKAKAKAKAEAAPAQRARPVYQGAVPAAKKIGNVVAARKHVTMTSCNKVAGGWQASGTATSTVKHTYTITVFFTTSHATVQSFAAVKVLVHKGKTVTWTAARHFPAGAGTLCVLRGVA